MSPVAAQPLLPLVDRALDGKLEMFLLDARTEGQSYQRIRDRLIAEHGITVTSATVGNWCRQLEIEKPE